MYLQEGDGVVVKALRRVVEDVLQGTLDDAACSQNALAQFHQTLTDLRRQDRSDGTQAPPVRGAERRGEYVPRGQILHSCRG